MLLPRICSLWAHPIYSHENHPIQHQHQLRQLHPGRTPVLNGEQAITSWQVDTANPNKVLTVTGDITEEQVLALVEDAGFKSVKV